MEKWKNIYYNRLNPLGIFKLPFHSRGLDHRRFIKLQRQLHLNILLQRNIISLFSQKGQQNVEIHIFYLSPQQHDMEKCLNDI